MNIGYFVRARLCLYGNFRYIGLQVNLCFCVTTYGAYGSRVDCKTACRGNATTICGGLLQNSSIALAGNAYHLCILFELEALGSSILLFCMVFVV